MTCNAGPGNGRRARVLSASQGADQAELGDTETPGGDGQRGQQPDERERRERGLPGHLRLGQADAAQACEQDQPQDQVARRGSGGDPPAAGSDQAGGPDARHRERHEHGDDDDQAMRIMACSLR
jgi:hypothetical protein